MLALTKASKPSVIQVRTQNMYSKWFITEILAVLKEFKDELLHGSILTIDENKSRIRILPIEWVSNNFISAITDTKYLS